MNNWEKCLIERAQSGDHGAFEQLAHLYQKRIFKYALHRVRQKQDAEDITQETFIRAYKYINKYSHHHKFKTWLYTIATHCICDFAKKNKQQKEVILNDDAIATKIPDAAHSKNETKIDVDHALDCLRQEHRNALLLFYRYGFSCKEIARITTTPLNTVKTFLRRGKRELSQILKL